MFCQIMLRYKIETSFQFQPYSRCLWLYRIVLTRSPSPVSFYPSCSLVQTTWISVSTLHQLFTCVQLLGTHRLINQPFPLRSLPQLLSAAPKGGLKPAPECRFRGTRPHLLQSMFRLLSVPLSLYPLLLDTHLHQILLLITYEVFKHISGVHVTSAVGFLFAENLCTRMLKCTFAKCNISYNRYFITCIKS
jgi:hypothetical protein